MNQISGILKGLKFWAATYPSRMALMIRSAQNFVKHVSDDSQQFIFDAGQNLLVLSENFQDHFKKSWFEGAQFLMIFYHHQQIRVEKWSLMKLFSHLHPTFGGWVKKVDFDFFSWILVKHDFQSGKGGAKWKNKVRLLKQLWVFECHQHIRP